MGKGPKTHKASVKRFKMTASGKLKHKKQLDNDHLKAHKSNRTKNRQSKPGFLRSKLQIRKIKKLMS